MNDPDIGAPVQTALSATITVISSGRQRSRTGDTAVEVDMQEMRRRWRERNAVDIEVGERRTQHLGLAGISVSHDHEPAPAGCAWAWPSAAPQREAQ